MSCLVLLVFVLIVTVPFCFPVIVSSGDFLSFFLSFLFLFSLGDSPSIIGTAILLGLPMA